MFMETQMRQVAMAEASNDIKQKAKKMMNTLLSYQIHLGLMSEGIDVKTGELVGNFPQGYSHLGLIDACLQFENQGGPFKFKIQFEEEVA